MSMNYFQQFNRNRSLIILMLALLVAVTSVTSVAFFVDRVDRSLILQGASLMAADLVVSAGDEAQAEWLDYATSLDLDISRQVLFPSVIFHDDQPVLIQVKAVDNNYPLRGEFLVQTDSGQVESGPQPGEAYGSQSLFSALARSSKDTSISLGKLSLKLRGQINREPDVGGRFFQFAPRLVINYEDVLKSGLLTPASRAQYRLLLAGPATAIAHYRSWVEPHLEGNARLLSIENANPAMRTALERGRRFLNLAALCATLLSGLAIMLASRQYVIQAMDAVAVMRTLGMTGNQALLHHLKELARMMLAGSLLGICGGYLGQAVLYQLVGEWFGESLPQPGLKPLWLGLAYTLILVPGFSLPALWRIRGVSPLRVLRRDYEPAELSTWISWSMAILAFAVLVSWQVADQSLAMVMLGAVTILMLVTVVAGRLVLRLISPLRHMGGGIGLGVAAITRHSNLTLWQLTGFTLGITMLLLLAVVRVDLLDRWKQSLPAEAPNHFLVNIQPEEKEDLQQWFDSKGIKSSGMYATARGRLTHIDGRKVSSDQYTGARAQRLAAREFSLGFSDALQQDNRVVRGSPWQAETLEKGGFSVEVKLAESLGIDTGSVLSFDIAGRKLSAAVVNLRTVAWDSFNVNFFVQGTASLKQNLPIAYINSVFLDDENRAEAVRKLADQYPAVSLLDVRHMLQRVEEIMDKGVLAIESVFLFTLMAAALVTFGSVQISRDQRAREIAVLRTLGASRQLVLESVLTEFGLLGLMAGVLGALFATITGQLIASRLFDLEVALNFWMWLIGISSGVTVLLIVGYFAMRVLLRTPPIRILHWR